jgi:hypothetical protein
MFEIENKKNPLLSAVQKKDWIGAHTLIKHWLMIANETSFLRSYDEVKETLEYTAHHFPTVIQEKNAQEVYKLAFRLTQYGDVRQLAEEPFNYFFNNLITRGLESIPPDQAFQLLELWIKVAVAARRDDIILNKATIEHSALFNDQQFIQRLEAYDHCIKQDNGDIKIGLSREIEEIYQQNNAYALAVDYGFSGERLTIFEAQSIFRVAIARRLVQFELNNLFRAALKDKSLGLLWFLLREDSLDDNKVATVYVPCSVGPSLYMMDDRLNGPTILKEIKSKLPATLKSSGFESILYKFTPNYRETELATYKICHRLYFQKYCPEFSPLFKIYSSLQLEEAFQDIKKIFYGKTVFIKSPGECNGIGNEHIEIGSETDEALHAALEKMHELRDKHNPLNLEFDFIVEEEVSYKQSKSTLSRVAFWKPAGPDHYIINRGVSLCTEDQLLAFFKTNQYSSPSPNSHDTESTEEFYFSTQPGFQPPGNKYVGYKDRATAFEKKAMEKIGQAWGVLCRDIKEMSPEVFKTHMIQLIQEHNHYVDTHAGRLGEATASRPSVSVVN